MSCCTDCDELGLVVGPQGNDGGVVGAIAKVTIASAKILTANTSPYTLIAAPGDGKAIKVISWSTSLQYNSAAYTTNTTAQIYTDTATAVQGNDTVVLTSTATRHITGNLIIPTGATSTQLIANKALLFNVLTGNPAVGNSDITVYVNYVVINL